MRNLLRISEFLPQEIYNMIVSKKGIHTKIFYSYTMTTWMLQVVFKIEL